jgi:hypothetical protein
MTGTTIRGRGRLTGAGVAIPVTYVIRIPEQTPPRLVEMTADLVRLDQPELGFHELVGRLANDLVLELEDRTWGVTPDRPVDDS